MLFEDEDDIFTGSPKSKYFDIMFNANPGLSQKELEDQIEKMAIMELLFEEMMGEEKDLEAICNEYKWKNQDKVQNRVRDLYIISMGNIVTQSEA